MAGTCRKKSGYGTGSGRRQIQKKCCRHLHFYFCFTPIELFFVRERHCAGSSADKKSIRGTGKTQGVYQIARACKRKIVLSEFVRSRYVGQSEMLMREFFDDYDRLTQAIIRRGENAPILLFDEADGLFTRRGTVKHSSDVHENALQDLLLTLIGDCKSHCIIFLTTNIASNIDDAFMRRILYHVHLTPPQMKVRENIIRSIFPSLSDKDVYTLAAEELTGANWNNVYRKSQINYIINNDRVTATSLLNLCKLETHKDKPQRIGFC